MDDFTFWERNLFLLAIVVISLFQWIFGKLQERRQRRDGTLDREDDEGTRTSEIETIGRSSETDREPVPAELRKFLEALGVDQPEKEAPRESKPERPVGRRSEPPPVPREVVAAPKGEPGPPVPRRRSPKKRPAPSPVAALTDSERRALETIRSGKGGPIVREPAMRRPGRNRAAWKAGPVRAMLASPRSLRGAILLKEILDPPVALQSIQGSPSAPPGPSPR